MADTDAMIQKIEAMREEELIAFIRDTVTRLNATADVLERYAVHREMPNVGFDLPQGQEQQTETHGG